MKILHLLPTSQFSGAENVVCQIVGMFSGEDYEMIYCSVDGPIREALKERNVAFYPLKGFNLEEIINAVSRIKPDIIHAHDMRASYMASKVCGKVPVISHIHNNGLDSRSFSVKSLGFLWASRNIDKIFWVSKSAFSDYFFRRFVSKRSSVLPNVIDLDKLEQRFLDAPPSPKYDIVFLGRLQYPKNPMRFVDIIKKVIALKPDLKVAMIGDGEQREITIQRIHEHNLEDKIDMLGFVSNPMGILKNAKALVMTSYWEGTPMSSLEALGSGTPVVSTPIDGLKDFIKNGYNGYLSDSDDEMADQLYKIVDDENYYRYLSENALSSARIINDKTKYKAALLAAYTTVVKK